MSSIKDEEAGILQRLGDIEDKRPETPEAALAVALIMLNHKLDLVLSLLTAPQRRPE